MSSEKIKCDEQKLYDNTYITQGQLNKLKRGKMSSEKQFKCFVCKNKTKKYLNKTKQYFTCSKTNRVLCEDCVEIISSDEWGNDE
jgi:hypothetical protein